MNSVQTSTQSLDSVSILMTNYNKVQFLGQVFTLVKELLTDGAEVVIVDDGSTDGSFEALSEFSKLHPEIIFVSQKNKGSAAARNRAIDLSGRDFIVFLDFDDKIDINVLIGALRVMLIHQPDMGILNYEILPYGGICEMPFLVEEPSIVKSGIVRDSLFKSMGYWRYIYSRTFVLQNHLQFKPRFSEVGGLFILDDLFWLLHNCSLETKILFFPSTEILYTYNQGINDTTDWLRYQNQVKLFPKAALIFLEYTKTCNHFHDSFWLYTTLKTTVQDHLRVLTLSQLLKSISSYREFNNVVKMNLESQPMGKDFTFYIAIFSRSTKNSLLKFQSIKFIADWRAKRFKKR
jgi:glycosyltransferase involved in cell wall biosynthesis